MTRVNRGPTPNMPKGPLFLRYATGQRIDCLYSKDIIGNSIVSSHGLSPIVLFQAPIKPWPISQKIRKRKKCRLRINGKMQN